MAIKVAQQKLTVYAPFYVPQTEIDAWLKTKQDWVDEQIAKQANEKVIWTKCADSIC